MPELEDIFKAPLLDNENIKRSLIMTGMTLLFFLVIPLFILAGYYAKVANHRGEGLPPIGDYMELLVTGLKVWTGKIVFLAPMFAVFGLEPVLGEDIVLALFAVLLIPSAYIPAMVVGIGKEGSLREGFSRETISRAFSVDYLLAWLAVIGARMVIGLVQFILLITIVGILLLPLAYVYEKMVTWRLFGHFLDLE